VRLNHIQFHYYSFQHLQAIQWGNETEIVINAILGERIAILGGSKFYVILERQKIIA